jgi:hypothetical protein
MALIIFLIIGLFVSFTACKRRSGHELIFRSRLQKLNFRLPFCETT